MYDKEKLGKRYACFQCGTKFYDLNRPEPLCPECGVDQREAPVRDIKSLLAGRRNRTDDVEDGDADEDLDEDFMDDDDDDLDEDDEEGGFEEDE